MPHDWHKASARRYQRELEEMSDLEFAQEGLKRLRFAYGVMVLCIAGFGYPILTEGLDGVPGMAVAVGSTRNTVSNLTRRFTWLSSTIKH